MCMIWLLNRVRTLNCINCTERTENLLATSFLLYPTTHGSYSRRDDGFEARCDGQVIYQVKPKHCRSQVTQLSKMLKAEIYSRGILRRGASIQREM